MDDCPICYETVDDSTGHCTLSCKHSFHIACLTKWGKDNPSCPMCRKGLGNTEVAPPPEPLHRVRIIRNSYFGSGHGILADILGTALPDAGGDNLEQSDIELVMTQGHVSREAAAEALTRHGGDIVNAILDLTTDRRYIRRIGDDVEVTEHDIQHVMTVCHSDRGMAVRALRWCEGRVMDAISWISRLPPVVHLRPPPPRDPVSEPSDEQATAWFIQKMFRDDGLSGYHWNSYSDMVGRTKTTTRNRNEFWMHLQFNGFENEGGYESA